MGKQVKCISCEYARPDKNMSEKNWTAYNCGNPDSDYYGCLLNVSVNGDKHKRISWGGCPLGRRKPE